MTQINALLRDTCILYLFRHKMPSFRLKSNHANQKQVYLEYFYFDLLLCYLLVKEQYHFQVLIENGDTLFLSPLVT